MSKNSGRNDARDFWMNAGTGAAIAMLTTLLLTALEAALVASGKLPRGAGTKAVLAAAFAGAFVGALMNGRGMFDAARIAANYTVRCIENTVGDSGHWYGAKFETALPELIAALR